MTDSNDSHLTLSGLGYDFVTAITQDSINSAIIDHLDAHRQETVSICYVHGKSKPEFIAFEELLKLTNGTDPFEISEDANPADDSRFQDLFNARFLHGFRCRLGIPPMTDPSAVPDFVTLGDDTSRVLFNLLCAECSAVELKPANRYESDQWIHHKQKIDDPWIFQSKVDLRLNRVGPGDFAKLRPEVQNRIKNLGDTAFSVEQLIFDFENASISEEPNWVNRDDALGQMLVGGPFSGTYYKIMRERGEPLLGCIIKKDGQSTPKASLELTDFDFKVCPFLDSNGKYITNPTKEQQRLATLNYLCATGGRKIEKCNAPAWNWLSEADTKNKHGVISINRNTFAEYLRPILWHHFSRNHAIPFVRCGSGLKNQAGFFSWQLVPVGTEEALQFHAEGDIIFTINWKSEEHDEVWLDAKVGRFKAKEVKMVITYSAEVQFRANSIVITQDLKLHNYSFNFGLEAGAYLINKVITDTYSIGVDSHGKLQAVNSSKVENKPDEIDYGIWTKIIPGFKDVMDMILGLIDTSSVEPESLPLSVISDFVFPGGKTFVHQDVRFSKHRDLVSSIRYAI